MWRAEVAISIALTLFITFAGFSQLPTPAAALSRDEWFIVSIGDVPCGWLHERVVVAGPRIETSNEMRLTVGRAGAQAQISVRWQFDESPEGTPISCAVEQSSGAELSQTTYRFGATHITVEERAGGRTNAREMPKPAGEWLTPAQVERTTALARARGSERITYATVDPATGLTRVEIISTRISQASVDGAPTTWKTQNSVVPMATIDEIDSAGRVISSRTPLAIGDMVARRSSEHEAKRAAASGGVDVISRSIVSLARAEPKLLSGRRASLAVKAADDAVLSLASGGSQLVKPNPAGGLFVDIEVGRSSLATAQEVADPRYLASTILIDGADPAVRSLALRALASAGLTKSSPAAERAEATRALVMRFIIHKDLATAFAGASAVVQSRAGDCSEHAILLAALLRAQNIPSRVASGLVYASEFAGKKAVFAWHMWTQAQIDGRWIDLDATLDSRAFHPGHLMIATSAQDDAQLDSDFSGLLATIGNLSIEVVDVD